MVCWIVVVGSDVDVVWLDGLLVVFVYLFNVKVMLVVMSKEEYFFIILSCCYVKNVNIICRVVINVLMFID